MNYSTCLLKLHTHLIMKKLQIQIIYLVIRNKWKYGNKKEYG